LKILFVEPPKDYWFVMGEYLPPPYGILQLAAFLEHKDVGLEIQILDCNAEGLDWTGLEKRIASFNPDIVASSSLATCNTYLSVRTFEIAKKLNPNVLTIAGGQHFSVLDKESIKEYPEIDLIIRGEGEQILSEIVQAIVNGQPFFSVKGITYRNNGHIIQNPPHPFIENLDNLPFPGYNFVENLVGKYHFTAMAGNKTPYALIEGSRGCSHQCTFCTQWKHWGHTCRKKSPQRIADEFEFCYEKYGSRFFWLTDDNFGLGKRAKELGKKLIQKGFSDDIIWFMQARCDDVAKNTETLSKLRRAGLRWILLGIENNNPTTLKSFQKNASPEDAKKAVKVLKKNDIFSQGMFIIGQRKDTKKSMEKLRIFVNDLDPDLAIFGILTPFPGTEIFDQAKNNGWIENWNWADYDMIHAIMPTETLSIKEVQEELYNCYRSFFGSWRRRIFGLFSRKALKRRLYWYMASQGIVNQVKALY
jgi:anaerobic magnesium-protoporphyrin IX monomethyl ester cyclase